MYTQALIKCVTCHRSVKPAYN